MKKWLKRLKKDERGLTLVELLAVVVILAIVAAIAFVMVGNVIDNSKKDAHVSNALQIISSAKLYEASGGDLADGVSSSTLNDEEVLGSLLDPWTKEAAGYGGTVTKSGDSYSVEMTSSECEFTATPEGELISKGRDICTD